MSDARIQLANGVMFDLLEPDSELIEIEAIAHSLSQLCRFTGHSTDFYSVAQHCVVVSRLVPAELALDGLLHDGAEAFIGDVSTPLKRMLPQYRAIENNIEHTIGIRFGVFLKDMAPVKHADRTALATERRDLGLPGNDEYWDGLPEPAPWTIVPLGIVEARLAFLARFAEIVLRPGEGQAPAPDWNPVTGDMELVRPAADYLNPPQPREKLDPNRFDSNEDVSRRLAEAESEDDDDRKWDVVG